LRPREPCEYNEMLVSSFAEAQAAGSFDVKIAPRIAVNVLIGAANWMCQWLRVDRGTDVDGLTNQVIEMLATGFLDASLLDAPAFIPN
jgi:hypothetical protein